MTQTQSHTQSETRRINQTQPEPIRNIKTTITDNRNTQKQSTTNKKNNHTQSNAIKHTLRMNQNNQRIQHQS